MAALVLRSGLELAAAFALTYAATTFVAGPWGWLLALVLCGAAGLAWGLFVAPRALVALPPPARLAVEVTVFAAACAGLLAAGRPVLAAVLGGLYLLHRLALWFSGAPAFEPHPGPGGGGRLPA